jgi:DNA helicase HerA-like ATPase
VTEAAVVLAVLTVVVTVRHHAGSDSQSVVRLTFPRTITYDQAVAAARALAGLLPPWWRRIVESPPSVTVEVRAAAAGIEHVLSIPATRVEYVIGALRAAIPGLRVDEQVPPLPSIALARELRVAGTGLLRTDAATDANAGILASLQPLGVDERAVIQYVITPDAPGLLARAAKWAVTRWQGEPSESPASVEPAFAVAVRVGVSAPVRSRTAQLMARLLGSFHALNTPDARLVRRLIPSKLVAARMRRTDPGRVVVAADELAAAWGIPLAAPALPGLTLARSRELPPVAAVPRQGLILGESTVADTARPVAVSFAESRRGIHVCAPTGAGKSTTLINLATQLMQAEDRPGLIVIDSKGDLIAELVDRIPEACREGVLVFDPADHAAPVGFNLIGGIGEAGLIVDHVVADLRARYGAAGLGPRSEDVLRAALTTLTSQPGRYTLCEVEPLLTNAAFRQKLLGGLDDPVLQSFWAWYDSLSPAARGEAIAPLANKIRTYTLRRRVRAVIGQTGGLDLADALGGGKVVLISLAKGTVGADAAGLMGAAMISRLWTAIQARASVPPEQRRPATVICDEFQDFAAISPVFADAVAQSRGYGVGWVLAHQHLAQLDTATRQAVLANCRSRLVMQTTADDARTFAREFAPYLDAPDLQGLGPFEGYATVSTGASVAPPASVRTSPAPDSLGCAENVRAASRARYGTPATGIDDAIRARVAEARPAAPVGGMRRTS